MGFHLQTMLISKEHFLEPPPQLSLHFLLTLFTANPVEQGFLIELGLLVTVAILLILILLVSAMSAMNYNLLHFCNLILVFLQSLFYLILVLHLPTT